MKRFYLLILFFLAVDLIYGQNQPPVSNQVAIDRNNLQIRPNSRDYAMVRKGNNHQRMLQLRRHELMIHKQAMLNRKWAMDKRRKYTQQKMLRQQQNRQRMVHQRGTHR